MRSSEWREMQGICDHKIGARVKLARRVGIVKYSDQYGALHHGMGHLSPIEVTIRTSRCKDNWGSDADRYPTSTDVRVTAEGDDGAEFVQEYNNWGDSIGSEHPYRNMVTGDEYFVLGKTWGTLPMVEVDAAGEVVTEPK